MKYFEIGGDFYSYEDLENLLEEKDMSAYGTEEVTTCVVCSGSGYEPQAYGDCWGATSSCTACSGHGVIPKRG